MAVPVQICDRLRHHTCNTVTLTGQCQGPSLICSTTRVHSIKSEESHQASKADSQHESAHACLPGQDL
jgi:hypothetical protein